MKNKQKILIFGSNGLVGSSCKKSLAVMTNLLLYLQLGKMQIYSILNKQKLYTVDRS